MLVDIFPKPEQCKIIDEWMEMHNNCLSIHPIFRRKKQDHLLKINISGLTR